VTIDGGLGTDTGALSAGGLPASAPDVPSGSFSVLCTDHHGAVTWANALRADRSSGVTPRCEMAEATGAATKLWCYPGAHDAACRPVPTRNVVSTA